MKLGEKAWKRGTYHVHVAVRMPKAGNVTVSTISGASGKRDERQVEWMKV